MAVPVEDVLKMSKQGLNEVDIIKRLSESGYNPVQISDALNQAKIKSSIGESEMTPSIMPIKEEMQQQQEISAPQPAFAPAPAPAMSQIPSPEAYPYYQTAPEEKISTETIEEITEEIVNEKWREVKTKVSDVVEWKNYAERRITAVDDRLKRIELSLDRLQAALLGKVQEYGRNIKDVGSEVESLEGAFSKVLSPLISNVKELGRITEEIKSRALKKPAVKKKK